MTFFKFLLCLIGICVCDVEMIIIILLFYFNGVLDDFDWNLTLKNTGCVQSHYFYI